MEKRFTQPGPVLDEKGCPVPGWASSGLLRYDRGAIRARAWRIKEWDWFQVNDRDIALQFTFGHAAYAGQVGVMLFDFRKGEPLFTKDVILALPFGSLGLEASAEDDGVLEYNKKGMFLRIENAGGVRRIQCRCEGLTADVTLRPGTPQALVLNVPFRENPHAFYYNHKISCLHAEGTCEAAGRRFAFGGENEAWGLLDWGRGVWPFHNEWYWASASGRQGGEIFGLNLGCGFGDTSNATENAIFYKDEIHKLGPVRFILGEDYDAPWRLADEAERLDVTLRPTYDRTTAVKLLWVDNCTHQMFGDFEGFCVLDDGTRLDINSLTGFAEHAVNNW